MADPSPGGRTIPDPPIGEPRLESWGEIAAYLRREIRTVQRWERYQGLPVRRLVIGKLGSVYAYRSELDKWFRERQPAPENSEEEAEKGTNGQAPPPGPRFTRLHITITLLALIVLAVVIPSTYLVVGGHFRAPSRSGKIRLVVLPFANLSGDS